MTSPDNVLEQVLHDRLTESGFVLDEKYDEMSMIWRHADSGKPINVPVAHNGFYSSAVLAHLEELIGAWGL